MAMRSSLPPPSLLRSSSSNRQGAGNRRHGPTVLRRGAHQLAPIHQHHGLWMLFTCDAKLRQQRQRGEAPPLQAFLITPPCPQPRVLLELPGDSCSSCPMGCANPPPPHHSSPPAGPMKRMTAVTWPPAKLSMPHQQSDFQKQLRKQNCISI